MKKFLQENWQIIFFETLVISIFALFYGRFGDINIDSFREAYIPQEILAGKVLYKNIFCIYPPLGYFINALLLLIFGTKLKVLYPAGLCSTMGIMYLINKLSANFTDKICSFGICLLVVSSFILSPNVFTPFFPYSFGLLYGILFILLSFNFLIKNKSPLAYFFCALAICSKYEFLLALPLIIIYTKNINWKKNILALIIPIAVVFSILLFQGITLKDMAVSFGLIKIIGKSETLRWFYSSMGLVFRPEILPIYFESFIKFFIPYKFIYQEFMIWVFPVITILFALRFKSLTTAERIFTAASILISLKVFFALTLESYGAFFLPFALISLILLIPKDFRKYIIIYFIIWSFIIGFNNIKALSNKDFSIYTEKGVVKTFPYYGQAYSEAIKYLKTTPEKASVVVYPEGLVLNYMTNRKSDTKFYSLIPLYVETFGNNNIIKRLELIKPDYIIITNYDTSAYYYSSFGLDYAADVMEYIQKFYTPKQTFGDYFKVDIWKKK